MDQPRAIRANALHMRRGQVEIDVAARGNVGYRPQFQHKTARPRTNPAVSSGRGWTVGLSAARAAETAYLMASGAGWVARVTSGIGRSRIRGGTITS